MKGPEPMTRPSPPGDRTSWISGGDDNEDVIHVALHLAPTLESPSLVRRLLGEASRAAGLPDELADILTLCASESVTNGVVHAGTTLDVHLDVGRGGARVRVQDQMPASDDLRRRLEELPHQEPVEPLQIGGRGLALIDALTSAWGVDMRGPGKTIWFEVGDPPDQ
jgi:anti-sigma regulatory factor (Ser/Thr protein kinase)